MPVIPYGTGTSFEVHVNAPFGGVSVDTTRMNKLIAVHAEDLDCVVEEAVNQQWITRANQTILCDAVEVVDQ